MRAMVPALLAALLGGVALAQPSQKQHLQPPGAPAPAKPAPPAMAAPPWPPLPQPPDAPPALARLRDLIGRDVGLGAREASQSGETLVLAGAEFRREGSRLLVERLVIEGLADGGLRRAEARGLTAETPAGPFALEALDLQGLVLLPLDAGQSPGERLPHQIALEALRLAGLALGGPQPAALARLELSGWRAGQSSRLALEGLEAGLPPGGPVDRLRLDRALVEGHDLAGLLAAALRGEVPPAPGAGRQVKLAEGFLALSGGRPVGGVTRLLIDSETAADGAAQARLRVHDAFLEEGPGAEPLFEAVGLPRLSAELAIEASYRPAARRLDLSTLAFGVRDLGAIALGAVIEGVDPGAGPPDPAATRLVEARLRYLDQSLYARLVAGEARRERVPEPQIRRQHAQMLAAFLTDVRPDPALEALREALLRLVRSEAREVEVTLAPGLPVPFAAVPPALAAGPAEAVRLLGLRATAR